MIANFLFYQERILDKQFLTMTTINSQKQWHFKTKKNVGRSFITVNLATMKGQIVNLDS